VDNGRLPPALAQVTIHVNQPPVIRASANALITLPTEATLTGEEIDLGLADPNGTVTRTWTKVSGPGEVIFADARALTTTGRFAQSGVYVVKLTVETSGQGFHLTSEAELTIVANSAPVVDAGQDQTLKLPAPAELEGTVTDDGLPDPPGVVTTRWSTVSGPGSVTFTDNRSLYTQARFSQSGTYVLRLEAQDHSAAVPVHDDITIEVQPSPRVIDGLQTLFTFAEGQGTRVHDLAGTGSPVDLILENPHNNPQPITWLNPGLRFNAPVILKTAAAATQLVQQLKAANEITIEAWVKRAAAVSPDQQPGRIVTLSVDTNRRNFTLGQTSDDKFQIRLRTTLTDDNGSRLLDTQQSIVQEVPAVPDLYHLAFTRKANGQMRFYLNGTDPSGANRPKLGGTFDNWDGYRLAIGNELTNDRPWLGEIYLVAIYSRALSRAEVQQNFKAGI
jgi:hypothetical protein